MRLLNTHVLTMIVTSSYVTLGLAARDQAARAWAGYAAVTFVLAIANLLQERRCRRGR